MVNWYHHEENWWHLLNLSVCVPYDSEISLTKYYPRDKTYTCVLGRSSHSTDQPITRKIYSYNSVYPSVKQTYTAVQLKWKPRAMLKWYNMQKVLFKGLHLNRLGSKAFEEVSWLWYMPSNWILEHDLMVLARTELPSLF